MLPQQYCLRWRYHHSNLQTMFSQLLEREAFCDVTLACEGKTIKAHKIVLSACSTYFETILSQYEEKDPILIMKDVKFVDIKCLVEFMYKGEINVEHCHLATLLKTAEDLRIKGLAEVSWREDENASHEGRPSSSTTPSSQNGFSTTSPAPSAALPQVSTVMETPNSEMTNNKRKRGRPPIDDYGSGGSPYPSTKIQAKILSVKSASMDESASNDAMSTSDHDMTIWEEDQPSINFVEEINEPELPIKIKSEPQDEDIDITEEHPMIDPPILPGNIKTEKHDGSFKMEQSFKTSSPTTPASSYTAVVALEKEWPDVIKMNEYLSTGRRQQFWEEPFTRRVMDAIKNKNLEMKMAAELLGVSYGTLYGRYRDAYGCLKHPYRVREFWTEQGPSDILMRLKRKEITLFRAAEHLNVTPQTLSNYLVSMSVSENDASGSFNNVESYEGLDSEEDGISILPDLPRKTYSKSSVATTSSNQSQKSVLPHCPDITIIKKETPGRFNSNSDNSAD